MNSSDRYLDLEFNKIVEQIVHRAHSPLGKGLCSNLAPLSNLDQVRAAQRLIAEIQNALKDNMDISYADLIDTNNLFTSSAGIFGYDEFFVLYRNTRLANQAATYLDDFRENSRLWKVLRGLRSFPELAKRFEQIFDPDGEVLDTASPELMRIRRQLHGIRSRIQKTMQTIMNDHQYSHFLQDKYVTQRDDRYVLPIKESGSPFVKGIVQSQSGSGSTLFIEPEAVVPMNNEMMMLKQEEKKEIFRIFQSYTQDYRDLKREVMRNQEILAELDYRFAIGRLSNELGAKVPAMTADPIVKLTAARHPLLILRFGSSREVIPFDLELGQDYRFLVLSGPNTGGKTVLMKAVGLLVLMAASGLPIPADEDSQIGQFSSVFADIGDEQSIESALSTFSSHLDKINRMLRESDASSLVLMDEIGAATDPEQGSALAQAMMERFAEIGCRGIVTTHYTALKVFAESAKGCVNASMQFDMKSLHPTYRFEIGFPGDSFAIEVAASRGVEPELIERARSLAGSQNIQFTDLLKKMETEKKALGREHYEYQLKNRNLSARISELEAKEEVLEAELKARKQSFLKDLQRELIAQQKIYTRELEELRKLDKEDRKALSERKLQEISVKSRELSDSITSAVTGDRAKVFEAKPGDRVWLANFEADAIVIEIRGNSALVDMNGISFKTSVESLFASGTKPEPVPIPQGSNPLHSSVAKSELKLLGLTFDEARPLIDEFIDDAAFAGLHSLRIVHGKGTGALRMKVRAYLHKKKQVTNIDTPPMNEGGSGVTLVKI